MAFHYGAGRAGGANAGVGKGTGGHARASEPEFRAQRQAAGDAQACDRSRAVAGRCGARQESWVRLRDVVRLLGYASVSQLSAVAERLVGRPATSLARLRPSDLIEGFVRTAARPLVSSGTL